MLPTRPEEEHAVAPSPEALEAAARDEALRSRMKTPPTGTVALLAVIIVTFLLEVILGGTESIPVLNALGALNRSAVLDGQIWRVVSYGFLHAGFLHVALNSWVLLVVGVRVEQMLGTARFLALYTAAVIGGGLMALAASQAPVTVGASGGLFGLLAAEAIFVFTSRSHLLPPAVRAARQRAAVINLVLNLGISMQPHVSLSGHAGGAIAGALLMLVGFAPSASDHNTKTPRVIRGLAAMAALVLAVGFIAGVGFSGAPALRAGPNLVRGDYPELGWSVELPDALERRPGADTSTPGVVDLTFGDIQRDPAILSVARIVRDGAPTPENDEAELVALEEALRVPPDQTTVLGVERTLSGDRPAVVARYAFASGLVLQRVFVVRRADVARVETLAWTAFEPAYADAGLRAAASISPL